MLTLLKTLLPSFARKIDRGDIECLLLPFGSYAVGGYIRDADIDLVLICPWAVRRNDWCKWFPELLKQQPTVREVELIRRATVPIIKCSIESISVKKKRDITTSIYSMLFFRSIYPLSDYVQPKLNQTSIYWIMNC